FLLLWRWRKKIKIPGILFGLYLIFNGFERFWIEKIRVNVVNDWGLTQAEIISTLMFLAGIAMIILLVKKAKQKTASA
ncbi:MAG: prolipoprotein diacylglyceryl transferase family protein, partial [Flavobacteriales bacterium]